MKYLLFILFLSGCGKELALPVLPEIPDLAASPVPTASPMVEMDEPEPTATPSPTPTPVTTHFSLEYYTLTKSVFSTGGTTYYGNGSCTQYEGNVYCWDDGIRPYPGDTSGYSYWYMEETGVLCVGRCETDYFLTAHFMSDEIIDQLNRRIGYLAYRTIAEVFSKGVTTYDNYCSRTGDIVTCPNFILDTSESSR